MFSSIFTAANTTVHRSVTQECCINAVSTINAHNSHNNYQMAYQHPINAHLPFKCQRINLSWSFDNVTISPENCWNVEAVLAVWVGHCTGQVLSRLSLSPCNSFLLHLHFPGEKVTYIWPKQETGLVVVIGMQVIPNHWLSLQNLWTIRSRRSCISYLWFHFRQATFGWNIWTVVIRPWLSYYLNAKGQNTNDHNTS